MQIHFKLANLKGFYIAISRKKPFEKEFVVVERSTTPTCLTKEQLEQNLERVNGWIGNCDQKASFLLALVGVVTAIICTSDIIGKVKEVLVDPFISYWKCGAGSFDTDRFFLALTLIGGMFCLLLAMCYLLLCLWAKTNYDKFNQFGIEEKSLLFYGSVAKMKYDEFRKASNDYENDLQSQLYINSAICTKKFERYKIAVKFVFAAINLLVVALLFALFI